MTTDAEAKAALARLTADKARPDGVTAWCDIHRPDIEVVVAYLGVPTLSKATHMATSTLYSWLDRHALPFKTRRYAPSPPPAPQPPAAPTSPAISPDAEPLPNITLVSALMEVINAQHALIVHLLPKLKEVTTQEDHNDH